MPKRRVESAKQKTAAARNLVKARAKRKKKTMRYEVIPGEFANYQVSIGTHAETLKANKTLSKNAKKGSMWNKYPSGIPVGRKNNIQAQLGTITRRAEYDVGNVEMGRGGPGRSTKLFDYDPAGTREIMVRRMNLSGKQAALKQSAGKMGAAHAIASGPNPVDVSNTPARQVRTNSKYKPLAQAAYAGDKHITQSVRAPITSSYQGASSPIKSSHAAGRRARKKIHGSDIRGR